MSKSLAPLLIFWTDSAHAQEILQVHVYQVFHFTPYSLRVLYTYQRERSSFYVINNDNHKHNFFFKLLFLSNIKSLINLLTYFFRLKNANEYIMSFKTTNLVCSQMMSLLYLNPNLSRIQWTYSLLLKSRPAQGYNII